MSKKTFLLLILCLRNWSYSHDSSGLIINGKKAKLGTFAHSTLLVLLCNNIGYICGGSIVNQRMILTAGHCLRGCKFNQIAFKVGNVNIEIAHMVGCKNFTVHRKCKGMSEKIEMGYDIAVALTRKQLLFGPTLKRVALTKHPPEVKYGYVAGWGRIRENENMTYKDLRYTKQQILDKQRCKGLLDYVFPGTICAQPLQKLKKQSYPSSGDSGGALVVKKYIQIGIVSYIVLSESNEDKVVVYTYIPHYFDWIEKAMAELYCDNTDYN